MLRARAGSPFFVFVLSALSCGCASSSSDASPPNTGAPPASGSEPSASGATTITILGVTADRAAVYRIRDGRGERLEALDLDASSITVVADPFAAPDVATIAGRVVASWRNGVLRVWAKGGRSREIATGSMPNVFATSEDGARIAFTASADAGRVTVRVSSEERTIAEEHARASSACPVLVGFAGPRALVSACRADADVPSLRIIDPPGALVVLAESARGGWSADAEGKRVFLVDRDGTAFVHDTSTNARTPIDNAVAEGRIAPDGSRVVYRTSDLRLAVAKLPSDATSHASSSSTAKTQLADGVRGVLGFDHDFRRAFAYSVQDVTGVSPRVDLEVVSTGVVQPFIPMPTTPPDRLLDRATGRAVGFTRDGNWAIYLADVEGEAGTLRAHPLGQGAVPDVTLAPRAIDPRLAGKHVVFATNQAPADGLATVRLEAIRIDDGTRTSTIDGADARYAVTDREIVFSTRAKGVRVEPLH